MKQLLQLSIFLIIFITINQAQAQVGIGTLTPDPSAQLEINSTSKGLLIPKMTADDRIGIEDPAEGLLVYQVTAPVGFYVRQGGAWVRLATTGGTSIIPFSSGAPISMTTIFGFLGGGVGILGFGNSALVTSVNGNINLANGPSNMAFTVPRNGTITSISGFFSALTALALINQRVTVTAQLYKATPLSNSFSPISDAIALLAPAYSVIISPGATSSGTSAGLNIPVTAGSRLLMVFSIQSSTGIIIALSGYASAGIAISE